MEDKKIEYKIIPSNDYLFPDPLTPKVMINKNLNNINNVDNKISIKNINKNIPII